MTYREAVQIQIKALQEIYDNANGLRDVASGKEKDALNLLRSKLPDLWGALQSVDNNMDEHAAIFKLRGDYTVKVTAEDI